MVAAPTTPVTRLWIDALSNKRPKSDNARRPLCAPVGGHPSRPFSLAGSTQKLTVPRRARRHQSEAGAGARTLVRGRKQGWVGTRAGDGYLYGRLMAHFRAIVTDSVGGADPNDNF